MQQPQLQSEHEWLQRLTGEWTWESMGKAGPDKPPEKFTGTESVRTLGDLWVVCEGSGEMPGGGISTTIMTLGYDPARELFVGTFIASMMTHLWLYEGRLAAENRLELLCEGPSFSAEGGMSVYRDTIELLSGNERTLTSHVRGDDGSWQEFMSAHYRRLRESV